MRRTLSVIAAVALVICEAACSNDVGTVNDDRVGGPPVATSEEVLRDDADAILDAQQSDISAGNVDAANPSFTVSLAERIARDLRDGKDLVVTSYVALWYQHAEEPARNLYWGALYGHEAMFRPGRRSEIATRLPFLDLNRYDMQVDTVRTTDPLRIKVFAAPIPRDGESAEPTGRLVVVNLAYHDMNQAALDMGLQVKTGRLPEGLSDVPRIRQLLEKSYLMGYWGHNVYYGGSGIDCLERVPSSRDDGPRGVFMVGCQTARWYPQKFKSPGIEPLLFTTTNMAPEGYVGLALYDGIARELSRSELRENVAEAYRVYQKLEHRPVSLFVNEWSEIETRMATLSDCPRTTDE